MNGMIRPPDVPIESAFNPVMMQRPDFVPQAALYLLTISRMLSGNLGVAPLWLATYAPT